MHKTLLFPGNIVIDSYALFFVLALFIGGIVFYLEVRRRGWPLETMLFIMVGSLIGAILGTTILSIIFFDWPEIIDRAASLEFAGKTIIGGVAGGFAGVKITKKIVKYPLYAGDAFAMAIPLGLAVGRVGCFLSGCCFGTRTTLPWAVNYPPDTPAFDLHVKLGLLESNALESMAVHPAPLYELVFDLGLFLILFKLRDRFKVRGTLFWLGIALYCSFRFIAEFFREDSPFPVTGGLKPVQYLLLGVAIYYGYVVFKKTRHPNPDRGSNE